MNIAKAIGANDCVHFSHWTTQHAMSRVNVLVSLTSVIAITPDLGNSNYKLQSFFPPLPFFLLHSIVMHHYHSCDGNTVLQSIRKHSRWPKLQGSQTYASSRPNWDTPLALLRLCYFLSHTQLTKNKFSLPKLLLGSVILALMIMMPAVCPLSSMEEAWLPFTDTRLGILQDSNCTELGRFRWQNSDTGAT